MVNTNSGSHPATKRVFENNPIHLFIEDGGHTKTDQAFEVDSYNTDGRRIGTNSSTTIKSLDGMPLNLWSPRTARTFSFCHRKRIPVS